MDRYVTDIHERWMGLALDLAGAARGQTSPNPLVGAVVVKDGQLLGSGAHLKAGTPHAEVHALQMAGRAAVGSTLYVTLEPCNHTGRTPPCTEKVIAAGVSRVVIGTLDPDSRVSGEGVKRLQEAGIIVTTGVLEAACLRLNEAYFHHRRTGYPFVTMKAAVTLDGKTATPTGDSRWVTGEEARLEVHRLRHSHDAVMVGRQTAVQDRALLTTRLPEGGKNPVRVILDSQLSIPLDIPVTDTETAATWIFCTDGVDEGREAELRKRGVSVFRTGPGPRVDLEKVFQTLGSKGILSVLSEAGGELNASLLNEGWVNRVMFFIAPKLLGGKDSPTAVEGAGWERMEQAWELDGVEMHRFGQDWCVTGLPRQTRREGS
ncbi:bifunctional diaminohydroxyphosphoribosylaminopyrimidine deaminase/5-amino-6-(5-phosphoribosylamino)uracil reductase RibD [Desmospora profundinema]|uniref:Riboflavin biosynthesis protein RibD n=1 Tax=Desmospora profundinema TaxID=1571184 RepID=A0ABU1IK81_9BACL|nr:bifunctional diaminohydroxyphosphoribosylaminopyrimidine deaminase/5-amino-6-(5-phosphoribosylamino)uracil reductase RibD [Desmospora profundinema]MDR6224559.1 diaminohydroxyphosphoribosylaminopyrimidine deaminase/5-amino-6-(5-phosphoribosylamino)uracil reductase [Desmospora profundinema]